jgi:hypothetical protein
MTKTWIAIALVAAVSSPAASQISGASLAPDLARSFSALADNRDTGPKSDNDRVCLIRKSSGRTECRFMDEWRLIARQIEKAQAQPQR